MILTGEFLADEVEVEEAGSHLPCQGQVHGLRPVERDGDGGLRDGAGRAGCGVRGVGVVREGSSGKRGSWGG